MFIIAGLLVQLLLINKFYRSTNKTSHIYDELIEIDHLEQGVHFTAKNGEETKFFGLISDDDDEALIDNSNENVEFDSRKIQNKNSVKTNKTKTSGAYRDYPENSGSSTSSGVTSTNTSI
jgi:hypothetical protein